MIRDAQLRIASHSLASALWRTRSLAACSAAAHRPSVTFPIEAIWGSILHVARHQDKDSPEAAKKMQTAAQYPGGHSGVAARESDSHPEEFLNSRVQPA